MTRLRGLAAALLLASAAPALAAGRDLALEQYTEVLRKNPNDRDARHRRAARYAELAAQEKGAAATKRLQDARADYEALRTGDAADGLAAYGLAVVLSRLADWTALDTALAATSEALQSARAEDYAKLWHNLGVNAPDPAKARAAYTRALALAPTRQLTRLALAELELAADAPEAAEKQLEGVTGALGDDQRRQLADIAAALAARRMKLGDLPAAEALMARAERESPEPRSFVVRFNRALLVWHKGDLAASRPLALALADGDVPRDQKGVVTALLYNVARGERLANDLTAAEADLKKALELSPDDTPSLLLLSKILLVAGRQVEAATTARHCVQVDGSQDECRIAYADAFVGAMRTLGPQADAAQAKGDLKEAVALVKQALEIDPEDEVLKARLATLESEIVEIGKLRADLDGKLSSKQWDAAMLDLLELYRRVPDDPGLGTLEAALQAGIVGDRLALQRRAEDAEREGRLYAAAESWKKLSALDPNDEQVAAKAAAADGAWKEGLAADRESARQLGAKKDFAGARLLLAKWTEQGLKDEALKKQIDGLERIVTAQAQPLKASAEKKAAEKKWGESKTEFEGALKLDPRDKAAQAGKTRAEGHLDAAVGARLGRELYSQGVVLYSRGAYGEAIEKWSEILELPGAGEWTERAKSHISRAQRILDMMKTNTRASP